jgi:hypothetical protein
MRKEKEKRKRLMENILKNMTNCFGDGQCSKAENCIWRTQRKKDGKT